MPRSSTSGTGGRTSGVNYATASMFDRMYWSLQNAPNKLRGAQVFAATYQANTQGSAGSLSRLVRGTGNRY
jgi:hypothetical protein